MRKTHEEEMGFCYAWLKTIVLQTEQEITEQETDGTEVGLPESEMLWDLIVNIKQPRKNYFYINESL